ncbi:hypothetical protein C8F01DRAFT_1252393 [Mycena amicta]|nr:hypothetical protein C8F01DRAFT_1252393 [Mycena amicta]
MASDNHRKALEGPLATSADRDSAGEKWHRVVDCGRDVLQNPLRLFLQPPVDLILFITAVVYAVFSAVLASISSLLHVRYPQLNQTQLGSCFMLPLTVLVALGMGMAVRSVIAEKLMDWDYQTAKRKLLAVNGAGDAKPSTDDDSPTYREGPSAHPPHLPLHLRRMLYRDVLAVVLASIGIMNALQTLMLDLVPKQGSSITACNNLVRCVLSAAPSAIQPMLDVLGCGLGIRPLGRALFSVVPPYGVAACAVWADLAGIMSAEAQRIRYMYSFTLDKVWEISSNTWRNLDQGS